jgi:hypothetical protein
MSAPTRIVIPTKSLVTIDPTSPRASVKDAANLLSGASAGAGQGTGVNVVSQATVASEGGVVNPGGTSMAGGVFWVSSLFASMTAPSIQCGLPADTALLPIPLPDDYADVLAYVNDGIIPALVSGNFARQNLDQDFGSTPCIYTQVAAAVAFSGNITSLNVGDIISAFGVQFEGVASASPRAGDVNTFVVDADPLTADNIDSKISNHPLLCGKVIAVRNGFTVNGVSRTGLAFGSLTAVPQLPFSFSVSTTAVSVVAMTLDWVDGVAGQIDPAFGTPLVLVDESNELQDDPAFSFYFQNVAYDTASGMSPLDEDGAAGFAGSPTDSAPTITSILRDADLSPTPAHTLIIDLEQKAVTTHYPQMAPMSQLVASGSPRTVTQQFVRLLEACLSGTGLARDIDTVTLTTQSTGVTQQTLTWTVGSR